MSSPRPTALRGQLVRGIVAVCVLFAACSGGGGGNNNTPTAPTPVLTTLSVSVSPTTVQIGQSATASASGLDQNGAAIGTGTVTWSAGTPAVAAITSSGSITTLTAGQTQIIASAGGKTGQATLTVTAIPVTTTVTVSLSASSVIQGQTVTATAAALDQNGAPLTGRTVTWTTGSNAIATVTSAGVVTGVAAGQTSVIATIDGKTGQSTLTVTAIPVATVNVTPSAASLAVGATQQLTATTLDANGNTLTGRVVAWSSSDQTKATVNTSGLVTAAAAGTATITATSETKSGTSTITVNAVAVASVTVAPTSGSLAAGGTLQLTATTRDANANILSGRVVTWSSSDGTKASVSTTGLVTGVAAGNATITAASEGKSGISTVTVTATVASTTLTAAGQSISFLNSPNFSTTLAVQAGSQYLIAVVNTDPSNTLHEDFTLSGTFGSASSARVLPGPINDWRAVRGSSNGPTFALDGQALADVTTARRQAQNHLAILEANRQVFAQFGNPRAVRSRLQTQLGGRSAPISAAVSQTIGTVNKVYVRRFSSGSCTGVDSIGARTVAVGQHVIVLADTNRTSWPQAYRPDTSFYQNFANEYDQITWPHLLANIGNPLAYDALLSGVGKVTVTITPQLNNIPGLPNGAFIVAFVNACDFYPFASSGNNADFSNQTEMFYSLVPSATTYSVAGWEAGLRATAAHETKHIVSYTDRIINNSPVFEEIWLEEGLAQESSEIWERNFNQATWKSNATFVQTVGCEIYLGANGPACDAANNKPSALWLSHLPFLFQYLQTESTSNTEGLAVDTPSNYGAGWEFARWATDQYATAGEGAFIKSLVNDPQLSGLANLSQHTGQSIATLLVYWNMASAIFQTPNYTAADVRTTVPSFNFADIFKAGQTGLTCNGTPCGIFTANGSPTPVFPVSPIAFPAGTFTKSVFSVPGTSASFFLLSASTAGTQTLQLLSGTGGAISALSGFRVAILRVQ